MTAFWATLFGCGGNDSKKEGNIFPTESFSVMEGEIADKPVIGSINQAYKNYSQKKQYPWCLKISIALNNIQENGLPGGEELAITTKLENELVEEIKKIEITHYIGHVFNDGFLDIYIHLPNPKKVHNFLQTQINKEGLSRGFGYEINEDPNWRTVNVFMQQ